MALKSGISVVAALLATACAGSASERGGSASSTLHMCDPLATTTAPITLGTIAGIGRAPDGTLYVVGHDAAAQPTDFRVFISNGSVLQRQIVTSTVSGPVGYQLEMGSGADQKQLTVPLDDNGRATSITLLTATKGDADQETLSPVAAGELSAYTVANYTIRFAAEYDVSGDDGKRLVVFAPTEYVGDLAHERVFYGSPPTLTEYAAKDLPQAGLACGALLGFEVDGHPLTASLGDCTSTPGYSLTTDGQTTTLHATNAKAQGVSFQCL